MSLLNHWKEAGFFSGRAVASLVFSVLVMTGSAHALADGVHPEAVSGPVALEFPLQPLAAVRSVATAPIDVAAAHAEDLERQEAGLPPRFALTEPVSITPESDGTWESLDSRFDLWRLRITSPGALSINLGFTDYRLPKGARLTIYPADADGPADARGVRVFTDRDNDAHGELWTPVVLGDDIVVELLMPRESRLDCDLALTAINMGYRFFGENLADVTDKSGSCNIDVVCPEGDDWRREISSVGVISTGGSTFCTGFMMNNTAVDGRPLFMTANHCGINMVTDASLVVYWNFESPTCGLQSGGTLDQYMTGSTFLAASATSDFTLVEMDDPVDPDHGVSFAGWNNSSADPTSAIAIHHPKTDEKSISFENDPTSTTSYLQNTVPGDGTHIKVTDWDLGTTESGSSGSPLFDQDHHVVGQLHGGYAACTNDLPDWYGRLSVSWPHISQYLDPANTGAVTLDTYAPDETRMQVLPLSGAGFEGINGGPFTPAGVEYVVTNNGVIPLGLSLSADVAWVTLIPSRATVPSGSSIVVTVAVDAAAAGLPMGHYAGTLTFTSLYIVGENTTRPLYLTVGVPELAHSFDMNTDPGWVAEPDWAFGQPLGGGGGEGFVDPSSGFTGANVYGYNLSGNYAPNLPERHLVTGAIDCSDWEGVTLKFMRWLNVEDPLYDHASLAVSNDGINFSNIWSNGSEVTDTNWIPVEYNISAVADGQATVYLRWTMGTTDENVEYSGWNIDDVEIWGLGESVAGAETPAGYRLSVGNHPNPFNPLTTISFGVASGGHTTINVYDLKGRLVRSLIDEAFPAGSHSVPWDGMNDSGLSAGSGVYLVRVVNGGRTAEHKMVLLK